jgi:signal transduction histidine kinase
VLGAFPVLIGRAIAHGIVLEDPTVSSIHAELVEAEGGAGVAVRDLGSRNGTFVNDVAVEELVLRAGDLLRVGETRLRVERAQKPREPRLRPAETARCSIVSDFALGSETATIARPRKAPEAAGHPDRRVRLLYALGRSVAGLLDPPSVIDAVAGVVADVTGADEVAIYEPEPGGALAPAAGRPEGRAEKLRPRAPVARILEEARVRGEAASYDSRFVAPAAAAPPVGGPRSALAVPFQVTGGPLGVLYAASRSDEHVLGIDELWLLGAVALQAAATLGAARLYSALREHGDELERRVAQRTEEIRRQADEIRALAAEKENLLRMVAHDLRSPLAGVIGFADLAIEDLAARRLAEASECLGALRHTAERMRALLDDLLTAQSVRSGRFEVRAAPTDVRALLRRMAVAHEPDARSRGLVFEVAIAPGLETVSIDGRRVEQVIENLLSNAVRASPEGGRVLIAARAGPDRALKILVADEGPGLDPAALALLTEGHDLPLDGRGGRGTGFGLGLHIVRNLVAVLGARLDVRTAPGAGTSIEISFPGAIMAEDAASAA